MNAYEGVFSLSETDCVVIEKRARVSEGLIAADFGPLWASKRVKMERDGGGGIVDDNVEMPGSHADSSVCGCRSSAAGGTSAASRTQVRRFLYKTDVENWLKQRFPLRKCRVYAYNLFEVSFRTIARRNVHTALQT